MKNLRLEVFDFYDDIIRQVDIARESFAEHANRIIDCCKELRNKTLDTHQVVDRESWLRERAKTDFNYEFKIKFEHPDKAKRINESFNFLESLREDLTEPLTFYRQKRNLPDDLDDDPDLLHDIALGNTESADDEQENEGPDAQKRLKTDDSKCVDHHVADHDTNTSDNVSVLSECSTCCEDINYYFANNKTSAKYIVRGEKLAILLNEVYPFATENRIDDLYGDDAYLKDLIKNCGGVGRVRPVKITLSVHYTFGRKDEPDPSIFVRRCLILFTPFLLLELIFFFSLC